MSIKIKKNEENPESKEILAEAIVNIGAASKKLLASGLNRDAIVVLLHDATKISKRDINIILNGLTRLEGWYCK